MKKPFVSGIALVGLLAFTTGASSPAWLKGTFDEALAKAKATGKLLLLDFFQEYG
jgi:hypothetical protein